jgi:predicted PurR-regulated permease PerM
MVVYRAPGILTLVLGGAALALALSFPVRLLSHVLPKGVAILLSLLGVIGFVVLSIVIVAPILAEQLDALVASAPGIVARLQARLPRLLGSLADRGLLPSTPERFSADVQRSLLTAFEAFARRVLGGLGQFISGALSTALMLFGIIFLAVYFLADARRIEAGALRASPHRYRRDVRDLWNAFRFTLSRYLVGLALSLAIQGVLSAIALYFLGVPYPVLLGGMGSGHGAGALPGGLDRLHPRGPPRPERLAGDCAAHGGALSRDPAAGGKRAHAAHPGAGGAGAPDPRVPGGGGRGELFGLMGVVFAVPIVAVFRVLFDFFHARLRTTDRRAPALPAAA